MRNMMWRNNADNAEFCPPARPKMSSGKDPNGDRLEHSDGGVLSRRARAVRPSAPAGRSALARPEGPVRNALAGATSPGTQMVGIGREPENVEVPQ